MRKTSYDATPIELHGHYPYETHTHKVCWRPFNQTTAKNYTSEHNPQASNYGLMCHAWAQTYADYAAKKIEFPFFNGSDEKKKHFAKLTTNIYHDVQCKYSKLSEALKGFRNATPVSHDKNHAPFDFLKILNRCIAAQDANIFFIVARVSGKKNEIRYSALHTMTILREGQYLAFFDPNRGEISGKQEDIASWAKASIETESLAEFLTEHEVRKGVTKKFETYRLFSYNSAEGVRFRKIDFDLSC